MLSWGFLAPIAVFAFSTLITPGPNNIIITTTSVVYGFRKSIPTILGVSIGFSTMMFIVAAGIGGLITNYPIVYELLRWISFAFICYLSWKIATAEMATEGTQQQPPGFRKMALFQWVNPKAWAMCSSAAAAFVSQGGVQESALIAAVFLSVSLPCQFLWGAFGTAIGDLLRSNRLYLRIFNVTMAALLFGTFSLALFFG